MDLNAEQIIELYGEYLYHLNYLYMKDYQLAEEVTQDVIMKFLLHKDKYRKDASLKTYLTRIAINCCHDELRRKRETPLFQSFGLSVKMSLPWSKGIFLLKNIQH